MYVIKYVCGTHPKNHLFSFRICICDVFNQSLPFKNNYLFSFSKSFYPSFLQYKRNMDLVCI
jgi:hypothetical protein